MGQTIQLLLPNQHLVKTVIYTLGHILIAMLCLMVITGSSASFASIDAIVEPLINALWFYCLEKIWKKQSTTLKTLVYTLGHMVVATACILAITGSQLQYALIDAVIEPCINGVWYLLLEKIWPHKNNHAGVSYEN